MQLLTYYDSLMNVFPFVSVLLFNVQAPHSDCLMHPVPGIELRTNTSVCLS